jgi:hypothetical protein
MSVEDDERKGFAKFDGKSRNFDIWNEKFISRAYKKKFYEHTLRILSTTEQKQVSLQKRRV